MVRKDTYTLDYDFERLSMEDLEAASDIFQAVLDGTHEERNQKAIKEMSNK